MADTLKEKLSQLREEYDESFTCGTPDDCEIEVNGCNVSVHSGRSTSKESQIMVEPRCKYFRDIEMRVGHGMAFSGGCSGAKNCQGAYTTCSYSSRISFWTG
jgi:hypothetical protein